MKASELRNKSTEELNKEIIALNKELFNLRIQRKVGEVTQTHLFEKAKRTIAQIKTILSEKEGQ